MPRSGASALPAVLTLMGLLGLLTYGGSTRVALLGHGLLQRTQITGDDFPKRLTDPAGTTHIIAAVAQEVAERPRPRVLYHAPGGYTMGAETLSDEMIQQAGGLNVAREVELIGPAKLQAEVMLSLAPDVIVVADWRATPGPEAVRGLLHNPV